MENGENIRHKAEIVAQVKRNELRKLDVGRIAGCWRRNVLRGIPSDDWGEREVDTKARQRWCRLEKRGNIDLGSLRVGRE